MVIARVVARLADIIYLSGRQFDTSITFVKDLLKTLYWLRHTKVIPLHFSAAFSNETLKLCCCLDTFGNNINIKGARQVKDCLYDRD